MACDYEVQWWRLPSGWKAQCEGIVLYGADRTALTARMRRQLAEQLLEEAAPVPAPPARTLPPTYTTRITPEPANPVSLSIQQYLQEHGDVQAALEEAGINPKNLRRLTDPFYWSHNTGTVRRIVNVIGKPLTLTIIPKKP